MTCYKCDMNFDKFSELRAHTEALHPYENYFRCEKCHLTFPKASTLEDHVKHEHEKINYEISQPASFCDECRVPFESLHMLKTHIETHHPHPLSVSLDVNPPLNFLCHICDKTFHLLEHFSDHMRIIHHQENWHTDHDLDFDDLDNEPITQLDGLEDNAEALDLVNKVSNTMCTPPTINQRIANFEINKTKQLSRIISDANKRDVEIVVNNSDENVNIVCSSGFFDKVAKPALCGLDQGYTISVDGISV